MCFVYDIPLNFEYGFLKTDLKGFIDKLNFTKFVKKNKYISRKVRL